MNKTFVAGLAVRTGTLLGATALVAMMTAMPASASGGDDPVQVVNTETVQVYTDATGAIQNKRIYEQLALTGHGRVDLSNPVDLEGLRNLDGFGGFTTRGSDQMVKTTVDGTKNLRSVSDFTGSLPLAVSVRYTLDGKPVQPGDIVGKSGTLVVTYTVKNVTSTAQTLSFPDGRGATTSKSVQVPVPMVGSLTTTLPSSFREVTSTGANMGGDGEGGTSLSFTMTLFPPIGSDTATFGYTAKITDGVVPDASISALPVDPLQSPTFSSAAGSYKGGAATGAELAAGATKIDSNLLKLRDGAARLLAGLIRLNDGAAQLHDGLAGSAAPGAADLATGADKLHGGADELHQGARRLSGGTDTAHAGGKKLTAGLKQLSGGLDQLAGQLPGASKGIDQLKTGINALIVGFGNPSDPTSLIGGLDALSTGMSGLKDGADRLSGGLQLLAHGDGTPANPGLDGARSGITQAKGGVDQVKAGLDASLRAGQDIDKLQAGVSGLLAYCGAIADPATRAMCQGTANAVLGGIGTARTNLTAASAGLGTVSAGLDTISGGLGAAITAVDTQLQPGADALAGGATTAKAGADLLAAGAAKAKAGARLIAGGLDTLAGGITAAVAGVGQLQSGSQSAVSGSSTLTAGLGRLSSGADRLTSGSDQVAGGAGRLASGADRLDAGMQEATSGSGRIADGLSEAARQAPAIPDGAQKLSSQGTAKLVSAGVATTRQYGQMYATIKAGAERARSHSMVIGAPSGAQGLAAYQYVIQGEDGETGHNVARAVGGAVLLGLAGLGFALRRRFA